jgi:UDP-glucose 4-epimerase
MKTPVFPMINNQRSMLSIENLCEFVRLMVENDEQGIFWPQNSEYSNTSKLVKMIAEAHGKKVYLVNGFGWILKIMSHVTNVVNKAFGNLTYDIEMSKYVVRYTTVTRDESIVKTERSDNAYE